MMHKWRASLFAFLLIGTLGLIFFATSSAYAACPDGMTSYWKLDEASGPAYEDFINGNDGTGAADPTAAAGQVNGAQLFDPAANTGIDVPADRSFSWYKDESFSIEFWIKRDGAVAGDSQVAIGRDDGSPLTSLHWWVGIEGGGANTAIFALGDNNGGSVTVVSGGTTDLTDNNWHHVVAVRDRSLGANGQNLLYVDGDLEVPEVNATYDAGFDSATADLNIGWLSLAPNYRLDGLLDEVALYDRALTPTEIQDHYNNGVAELDYCLGSGPPSDAPYPEDTISLWKLDEATHGAPHGTYEDSFNGNDGTGDANPTAAAGQVNGAQLFDPAANTGIDVPADRSFSWYKDESFSIEFWIKRDGAVAGDSQVAIGRDDGSPLTSLHWWVGIEGGGANTAIFALGDNNGGSVTVVSGGTTDLTDNNWHHVVAVRDRSLGANGQNLLYVDGDLEVPEVNATYDAGFDSATADLNIGWLSLAPNYRLDGLLDEVALYDRALTTTEIEQHYNDGLEGWGIDYIPVAGFTANPISGVRPLTVNFTDESTGNITVWSWDFGDGLGTSADQNPTYIYNNAGTYTVSLTVTGPKGTDTETKNNYIVVGDIAPVANFTADPVSGAYPLTVNFTDQSTGNITSWSWDFGDGLGTSDDQNPTYIYNDPGTYTVSLIVTGPDGTDTETKNDYIVVADIDANFTADPTSGVRPLTVNFTDQSTGNITSWSWDFGDGLGTSADQNPTYIYNNAGTYTVSLTVTGPNGTDTETQTDYITVSNPKSSGGGGGGCFIATAAK